MAEDNTGLTYEYGSIRIANNFDVSVTRPLDIRLVAKNVESLYDTNVMKSPYKGMLVNIEGTSDVYVYTGTYKDENGVIHDGVNGVVYPQNWSKLSTVEQFDDDVFREREYTDFELENFKNVMEKQLHNPSIGLLGHVRDTSKIYVLVNKDYTSPNSWKRVGGVMEEFSVPIFVDNVNDNNDIVRTNANNSPHNTFSNNESNPTTWVKINTSKSPESIRTFGGVEMVTTEMLNNNTDEIYEKIEDVEDKVDEVQDKLNMSVDDINKKIGELLKKHDDDIEKTIDELTIYINRLKNLILHGTIEDSDGMIHPSDDEKIDIEGTLKSIHYISDWLENHKEEYDNLVKIHNEDKEELKELIDKIREELNTFKGDTETAIEESLYYDVNTISTDGKSPDPKWKTIKVGGISANQDYTKFQGKTLSQMLTDILFPTLYPTIPSGKPSVSITYNRQNSVLFKVGASIPAKTAFTTSNDRGTLAYATAAGNTYYAGPVTTSDITIDNGGIFGNPIEDKAYTVTYTVTFDVGSQPFNNKGTTEGVIIEPYKGGTKTSTMKIYGLYPIFVKTSLETTKELELKNYIVNNTVTWEDIVVANEVGTDYVLEIHVPSHLKIKSVLAYNDLAKEYNATKYVEKVEGESIKHVPYDIDYDIYKNVGTKAGESKLQINIIKK